MTDLTTLAAQAETVLRQATDRLVAMQGSPLKATRKDLLDVVTEADLASEAIILEGLKWLTPDAAILAEESGAQGPEGGPRWIIDPLDGTVNFAAGLPWFSGTIAYQEDGETVIGLTHAPLFPMMARYVKGAAATVDDKPVKVSPISRLADAVVSVVITSHFSPEEVRRSAAIVDELGSLSRGVRVVVSGALEMSLVATGRMAGFVSVKADVVSHAAAAPLVRAAGGRITTQTGRDCIDEDMVKVCSNGLIHDELLAVVQKAFA